MMSIYLRRGIGDTASLVLRNLVRYQRRPDAILLVLVQPLMLVLLFRYTIGGAIRIPGTSYVNYLMPAAFAVAIVNASATLGIGVAEDLTSGMIDRLRALPIARSSFLLGRVMTDVVRNLILIPLVGALGIAVGFHFHGTLPNLALAGVLLLGLGFTFAWISILIALWSGSVEATLGMSILLFVLVSFVSSGLAPVETMPSSLRGIAGASPVTHVDNALRILTSSASGAVTHEVLAALIWMVAILAITVPLAVWRYSYYTQ
jgi:ABC-2 type transport system permease protein/oleandomycin transport system permease protein